LTSPPETSAPLLGPDPGGPDPGADPLVTALEKIAAEAKAGSLTSDQVEAITALVRAVADAVRPPA
jgi:hypothetical protein